MGLTMDIEKTTIPDVLLIKPKVFGDERGFFMESFNAAKFAEAVGLDVNFVQDNHSRSSKGVLRGLHYQTQKTPKANWCALPAAKCMMLRWICAGLPPHSGIG